MTAGKGRLIRCWPGTTLCECVARVTLTELIRYHFKEGSNQWWTDVQVRNHRNPIAKLEYYNGNQWVAVPRTDYNYFVQTNPGMGARAISIPRHRRLRQCADR